MTTTGADGRIPVLDIGPYLAGAPGAREELARHVARSCGDTGFLVFANHGIDQRLIDGCFDAARRFFALPEERKTALTVGALNIGYLPMGVQTIRTSRIHDNRKPNLNESFYIVRDRAPDDPDILAGKPFVGLNHVWMLRFAEVAAHPLRDATLIVSRGPFTVAGDIALMRRHAIAHVVAKNAGGQAAQAKLAAARALGLPVVMIDRPVLPLRRVVATPAEVMAWLHGTDRGV